ncbi:MAG: hypothetical protein ACTH6A_15520 [Brachybacterium tyrofermentans]
MTADVSTHGAPPGLRPAARPKAPLGHRIYHSFVLRRLLRSIFVIWVVASGVFLMVRLLPGNPVDV